MYPLKNPDVVAILALCLFTFAAHAVTPGEQQAAYEAKAGASGNPARGQQFFTTKHGTR